MSELSQIQTFLIGLFLGAFLMGQLMSVGRR